jgi:hypothetical protein
LESKQQQLRRCRCLLLSRLADWLVGCVCARNTVSTRTTPRERQEQEQEKESENEQRISLGFNRSKTQRIPFHFAACQIGMPLTPVLVASVTYYLVVEVADTTWRYSITTGIESRVIPRERAGRAGRAGSGSANIGVVATSVRLID